MLEILRLVVDFGLLIFIWLVQLIIYPSFLFLEDRKLKKWHSIYVRRLTYVAFPLMVGQLLIVLIQLANDSNIFRMASLVLILLVWVMTFGKAVPLHAKVNNVSPVRVPLTSLVRLNGWRTLCWTLTVLLAVGDIIL